MKYDLHIHSCLSPCADTDMTPNNIMGMATLEELEVIAVSDHNSALNLPTMQKLSKEYGITVVPAIEVCSSEDIHLLCFFKTVETAIVVSDIIYQNMPKIKNRIGIYNPQNICDEEDNVVSEEPFLLTMACDFSVYEMVDIIHKYEGLCFYSHIDKMSNSVTAILGDIPIDIPVDGYEVYDISKHQELLEQYPVLNSMQMISNSDAHNLGFIGENHQTLQKTHILHQFIKGIALF